MFKDVPYIKCFLVVGLMMIVGLVVVCLMPLPFSESTFNGIDKIEHSLAYLCITFYFMQIVKSRYFISLVIFFFLLGIAIECLQGLTAYRQFDVLDIAANSLGVIVAYGLARRYSNLILNFFNQN